MQTLSRGRQNQPASTHWNNILHLTPQPHQSLLAKCPFAVKTASTARVHPRDIGLLGVHQYGAVGQAGEDGIGPAAKLGEHARSSRPPLPWVRVPSSVKNSSTARRPGRLPRAGTTARPHNQKETTLPGLPRVAITATGSWLFCRAHSVWRFLLLSEGTRPSPTGRPRDRLTAPAGSRLRADRPARHGKSHPSH